MSFGQKLLEKYGWRKGDGLGANKDGIKEAIKPKRKANNFGLGYQLGAEFQDNWWENVYNEAASNISIEKDDVTCTVKSVVDDIELLPHKKRKNVKSIKENHSLFKKGCGSDAEEQEKDIREAVSSDDVTLFEKCGKRTVHKGARHGLSLSGKLARLQQQEEELLHTMKKTTKQKKKHKM